MRIQETRLTSLVLLGVLMSVAVPAEAQESGSVLLRLRLAPGMTYRMSVTQETDITQTVQGMEQRSHQLNETVALSEVLSVDENGVARVRTIQESARIVQDGPMGRTEYDSTDPESSASPALRPYMLMLGESLTMDLAPDGSVSGVEGMEDLLPRMLEEMDLPPGPMGDQVRTTLEEQFGADAMGEMMQRSMAWFPTEPVAAGDSWTRTTQVDNPIPLSLEMTWTLRERRGGVAYLDIRIMTVSDGTKEIGPMVMTYDTSGENTGTMEIDEATGLTLRMSWEGGSSGTITMSGPTGDMVMPMTTRERHSTELLSRG